MAGTNNGTVTLVVVMTYANQSVAYRPGEVLELDAARAAWLQADSPGSFAVQSPAIVAEPDPLPDDPQVVAVVVDAPTVTTAMRRVKRK